MLKNIHLTLILLRFHHLKKILYSLSLISRHHYPFMISQVQSIINLINISIIISHMLGETPQTFFTIKDLSAREFIEAFAQYLKKNNLLQRPSWADIVKTATSTNKITQEASLLLLMMIGFIIASLLSQERSIFALELELDFCLISMEDSSAEDALLNIMITQAQRSLDGDFNNQKSKD